DDNSSPTLNLQGGWTFENSGTLFWENGTINLSNATIHNASGGIFDIDFDTSVGKDANLVNQGGGTFFNEGTVNTDGLQVSATIGVALVNSGIIDVTSGTLDLAGGGTGRGQIDVWNGTTLNIDAAMSAGSVQVRDSTLGL